MILEITGLPGSGKSTLAKELNKVGFMSVDVSGRQKWTLLFSFIIKHPFKFLYLLCLTIKEGLRAPKLFFWKIFLLASYIVRTEKAILESNKGHKIVLEEGLLHYFLSLYEKKISDREAIKYFTKFVFSDYFIFLNLNKEISLSNIKERGDIPRQKFGINVSDWISLFDMNLNTYRNVIKQTKDQNHLIEIDSSKRIDNIAVETILSKIQT